MSHELLVYLGIAAGVINTIGLLPYLRDIFRHKTKPERATWWIWLVLNFIALSAQWAAGATWSLGLTVGQIFAVGLIAVLSLKYGYGKFHKKHYISLAVAGVGVLIWKLTSDPLAALVIVVLIDFMAFYLTIVKSWHAPNTETLSSWVLASIAAGCGVLAIGEWTDIAKSIYPGYIFIANSFLVMLIVLRRKRLSAKDK